MKPFTIPLRGKPFSVTHEKIVGLCNEGHLSIDPALKGKEYLNTILHEALHGCLWDLSEEAIDETAASLAGLLWKLSYRRRGAK